MKTVLILTAGFGEGHNSAARGLHAALQLLAPGTAQSLVLDLFAQCHGPFNDWSRQFYLGMINRTPKLWQWFYEVIDRTKLMENTLWTLRSIEDALVQWVEKEKPVAIVSVYPVYSFLIERVRARTGAKFRFITIVTDSITVNSVWYRAPSDEFIVANDDTAAVMQAAGVPKEKILPLGFPVTPRFFTEAQVRPQPSETDRRVLFMINHAKGEAPDLVARLLKIPGLKLEVTVGRDEQLRAAIERVVEESGYEATLHGWTNEMPLLLMRSHLLIGKAGGATVQETIAARTPMLVSKVVPGQEEGNARLLEQNDCGRVVEANAAIAATVEKLFAENAAEWRQWTVNIARLSRPRAALDIAEHLLHLP
jgi:processive 1,2-diacylglycerol beta-glucosyltransferase